MPTTLIASNPTEKADLPTNLKLRSLNIAEFFCDTIQGEGFSAGVPSTFLRLQGCTLNCIWCDTASVWRYGNPYTFAKLCELMDSVDLPTRLRKGQHLILTGGSPLKQQDGLISFINYFVDRYGFKPFIEVENEAVLRIQPEFADLVDQWNNSPKLANSGMKMRARYKGEILSHTSKMNNSWFKFVVQNDLDWEEIQIDFLDTNIISKRQVILMPCGEDQKILDYTRPIVADMAAKHGVRFSDRLHITIWDKKTGV